MHLKTKRRREEPEAFNNQYALKILAKKGQEGKPN